MREHLLTAITYTTASCKLLSNHNKYSFNYQMYCKLLSNHSSRCSYDCQMHCKLFNSYG